MNACRIFFLLQSALLSCVITASAQGQFSASTTFSNDTITIKYTIQGKKGVFREPHKIPINTYRIPQAVKPSAKPEDLVTMSTLNYRLLDSLTWEECNIYRKSKGLKTVRWNDTIYQAASHHSEYQVYFNFLAHGEPEEMPNRIAQQEHYRKIRVNTSEICLMRPYHEGTSTYRELAKLIIEQWKNSPGHNAIMITPGQQLNAFGCAFRTQAMSLFTKENLQKYNPELLAKIESALPGFFKTHKNSESFSLYATGNFTTSANVKSGLDFVNSATMIKNKDGTVTYVKTTGGTYKDNVEEKEKPEVKKQTKKYKRRKKTFWEKLGF